MRVCASLTEIMAELYRGARAVLVRRCATLRRVALPLPLRNSLAELILASLRDAEARSVLEAMPPLRAGPRCCGPTVHDLPLRFTRSVLAMRDGSRDFETDWRQHIPRLRERAARAWRAIERRPFDQGSDTLESTLDAAAVLFD